MSVRYKQLKYDDDNAPMLITNKGTCSIRSHTGTTANRQKQLRVLRRSKDE